MSHAETALAAAGDAGRAAIQRGPGAGGFPAIIGSCTRSCRTH
jgi:hypothetical protein